MATRRNAQIEAPEQLDFGWLPAPQRATRLPRYRRSSLGYAMEADDGGDAGGFAYGQCPEVFLGRTGIGPLRVAWDTNILSDFARYGHLMLNNSPSLEELPLNEPYLEELIALGVVMRLWETRDIRVVLFARHREDLGKRAEDEDEVLKRTADVLAVQSALGCVVPHEPVIQSMRSSRPHLHSLPASADRELVRDAIAAGCHVFLTRDRGVLSRWKEPAAHGLAILSPTGLLDALAQADMLSMMGDDGMFCDSHKWQHLRSLLRYGADDA